MKGINSLEELDGLIEEYGAIDCFIKLNHGAVSNKTINKEDDVTYIVYNGIDGSEDRLTAEEMFDISKTNIGNAITNKALYVYDYQFK